jgi:hypothetical protein
VNPFTRFLAEQSGDSHLQEFIAHWDKVERLVLRVYRTKRAAPRDEDEYRETRDWLRQDYPRWRERFRPFWEKMVLAGEQLTRDPFEAFLAVPHVTYFKENWPALQALPAARETLNQYLLDATVPGEEPEA